MRQRSTSRATTSHARPAIGALVLDRAVRVRFRTALSGVSELRFCETGEQLMALARDRDVIAIITEPRDITGATVAATVERLRYAFPSLPVIAYLPRALVHTRDILELARAGVSEMIRAGIDDEDPTLRLALASASVSCASSVVRRALSPLIPANLGRFASFILDRATGALTVADIARALGMSRRTLERRFLQGGIPSPRAMLAWSRLLMSAHLLGDVGRTVEEVALVLDFPSASALRNMLWRHAGLRARDLRRTDGLQRVVRQLERVIRTRQEDAARRSKTGHVTSSHGASWRRPS